MTDLFSVAADNAATMWLKLGAARGYEPVHGDGFIHIAAALSAATEKRSVMVTNL